MNRLVFILSVLFPLYGLSQDVINIDGEDCPIHGSSRPGSLSYQLNIYKNRYAFPAKENYDTSIRIQDLAKSGDPNQFSMDKAVIIRGYVSDVKTGGVETCNCKTKDRQFRDTHIELTASKNLNGQEAGVIVEVTPRLRSFMANKGEDWSTETLKQTITGRYVEVAGWLLYDVEHETEAFANDPDDVVGRKNWRATCWEVHPVTYLKIIKDAAPAANEVIEQQAANNKAAANKEAANKEDNTHSYTFLVILIVIAAALFLFLLLRK